MIVRAEGDRLVIFRQADHAHLSGRLAAAWGREPWDAATPFPDAVLGARLHDDAWEPFDAAPGFEAGKPLSFFEVDRVTTSALYAAGAEAVSALDPYAGLLVSLHYSGFFHSHWGWAPFSTPDRFPQVQAAAIRAFLTGEARRQRQLRSRLNLGPQGEKRLEVNYKWLQVWDRVSLDICRQSPVEPWVIQYPAIPVTYEGRREVAIKFAMVAPGRYTLNPYPLLPGPFPVRVPLVIIDAGMATREQFLEAWRSAPQQFLEAEINAA